MDREVGAGLGIVETHDHLPSLHNVAVVDEQLSDDATRRVLNLLYVGVNDDHAGRHHGACQFRRGRPAAHADHQQSGRSDSGNKMRPDGSKP